MASSQKSVITLLWLVLLALSEHVAAKAFPAAPTTTSGQYSWRTVPARTACPTYTPISQLNPIAVPTDTPRMTVLVDPADSRVKTQVILTDERGNKPLFTLFNASKIQILAPNAQNVLIDDTSITLLSPNCQSGLRMAIPGLFGILQSPSSTSRKRNVMNKPNIASNNLSKRDLSKFFQVHFRDQCDDNVQMDTLEATLTTVFTNGLPNNPPVSVITAKAQGPGYFSSVFPVPNSQAAKDRCAQTAVKVNDYNDSGFLSSWTDVSRSITALRNIMTNGVVVPTAVDVAKSFDIRNLAAMVGALTNYHQFVASTNPANAWIDTVCNIVSDFTVELTAKVDDSEGVYTILKESSPSFTATSTTIGAWVTTADCGLPTALPTLTYTATNPGGACPTAPALTSYPHYDTSNGDTVLQFFQMPSGNLSSFVQVQTYSSNQIYDVGDPSRCVSFDSDKRSLIIDNKGVQMFDQQCSNGLILPFDIASMLGQQQKSRRSMRKSRDLYKGSMSTFSGPELSRRAQTSAPIDLQLTNQCQKPATGHSIQGACTLYSSGWAGQSQQAFSMIDTGGGHYHTSCDLSPAVDFDESDCEKDMKDLTEFSVGSLLGLVLSGPSVPRFLSMIINAAVLPKGLEATATALKVPKISENLDALNQFSNVLDSRGDAIPSNACKAKNNWVFSASANVDGDDINFGSQYFPPVSTTGFTASRTIWEKKGPCADDPPKCEAGGLNQPCGTDTGCMCGKTATGLACVPAEHGCPGTSCSSDSDCGSGEVCLYEQYCCEAPHCVKKCPEPTKTTTSSATPSCTGSSGKHKRADSCPSPCGLSGEQKDWVKCNEGSPGDCAPCLTLDGPDPGKECAQPHTIGWGHDCTQLSCKGLTYPITEQQAQELFDADLQHFTDQVKTLPNIDKLNPNQLAALIDYSFNAGFGNTKKFFTDSLQDGDFDQMCTDMATAYTPTNLKPATSKVCTGPKPPPKCARPSKGIKSRRNKQSAFCKKPSNETTGCPPK